MESSLRLKDHRKRECLTIIGVHVKLVEIGFLSIEYAA
jgi:hypothetical protein